MASNDAKQCCKQKVVIHPNGTCPRRRCECMSLMWDDCIETIEAMSESFLMKVHDVDVSDDDIVIPTLSSLLRSTRRTYWERRAAQLGISSNDLDLTAPFPPCFTNMNQNLDANMDYFRDCLKRRKLQMERKLQKVKQDDHHCCCITYCTCSVFASGAKACVSAETTQIGHESLLTSTDATSRREVDRNLLKRGAPAKESADPKKGRSKFLKDE